MSVEISAGQSLKKSTWWSVTQSVLFSPATFFKELPAESDYKSSIIYLAKTTIFTALIHALFVAVLIYLFLTFFVSLLGAFAAIFGTIFSPFISVVTGIPIDKVVTESGNFAKDGGAQVVGFSVKIGLAVFATICGAIPCVTAMLAALAHGIAFALGGRGKFVETLRAYSYISAAWLVTVIPVVNAVAAIYGVVLSYFGLRRVHGLSRGKTVLAVALVALLPVALAIMLLPADDQPASGSAPQVKSTGGTVDPKNDLAR